MLKKVAVKIVTVIAAISPPVVLIAFNILTLISTKSENLIIPLLMPDWLVAIYILKLESVRSLMASRLPSIAFHSFGLLM